MRHMNIPIYARLGSRGLLAKCIDGYTQNANESLHNLVWRLCPKVLHLGKKAVEVACALAVCQWNDGRSSYQAIAKRLGAAITPSSAGHLQQRDIARMKKARYRVTDRAKALRRRARRMRKGLDESQKRSEGICILLGPSILMLQVQVVLQGEVVGLRMGELGRAREKLVAEGQNNKSDGSQEMTL